MYNVAHDWIIHLHSFLSNFFLYSTSLPRCYISKIWKFGPIYFHQPNGVRGVTTTLGWNLSGHLDCCPGKFCLNSSETKIPSEMSLFTLFILWILWQTSPSHPSSTHITSAKRHGIKNSDSLAKVKMPINSIATKSKSLRSVHCQGKILILWYIWKLSKETKRNVIIRRDIHEHMSFSCRSPDQWRMDQVTYCGKLVL